MQAEAIEAFNARLRGQRSLLRAQFKNSPTPFAANQFTDEAFKSCVRFIWLNSRNPTREWYDRAGTPGGDNWIIAWMLYHICRYRDGRNQRAQSRNFHDDDDLEETSGMYNLDQLSVPHANGDRRRRAKVRRYNGLLRPSPQQLPNMTISRLLR